MTHDLPTKPTYLEYLLGQNGPLECQESILALLDPADIKCLRLTSPVIRANPLLAQIAADRHYRNLLRGFCQYWRLR